MYGPVRTVVWQGSAGDRRPYEGRAITVKAAYRVARAVTKECLGGS